MIYATLTLTITDQQSFDDYREVAAPALKTHGCQVVSVGRNNQVIDGSTKAPDVIVLLSFPDEASAKQWMDDPALAKVHQMRRDAGDVHITLIT